MQTLLKSTQGVACRQQPLKSSKQKIHELEEKLQRFDETRIIERIDELTQQLNLLIDSHEMRCQDIVNLMNNNPLPHTQLEQTVLQLLNENCQLISLLPIKQSTQQETRWREQYIELNREYLQLKERFGILQAQVSSHHGRQSVRV